jgi:hypothetical protein
LHWEGGDHTQAEFQKLRSGERGNILDEDVVEIICLLARIEPDERIASILNRNQHRTAHGEAWTAKRVCSARYNHAISVYREGERQARDEMFVGEVSDLLGVTASAVLRLIRLKQLSATQACVGAPWIMRRADVDKCLAERDRAAIPPQQNSTQLALEIYLHTKECTMSYSRTKAPLPLCRSDRLCCWVSLQPLSPLTAGITRNKNAS